MSKTLLALFLLLLLQNESILAQNPTRFNNEVNALINKKYHFDNDKPVLLFVGSSSIRKWDNIDTCFYRYNVIKNGFGGSQFSDLIFFYDKLISGFAGYKPNVILIYEGDNDIADGKKPSQVLKDAKHLLSKIRKNLPETPIIFISVKPSISRWNLRKDYVAVNNKLRKLCLKNKNSAFVNVWNIMLNEDNNIRNDLFLKDKLHMNSTGYELWTLEISKTLNDILK